MLMFREYLLPIVDMDKVQFYIHNGSVYGYRAFFPLIGMDMPCVPIGYLSHCHPYSQRATRMDPSSVLGFTSLYKLCHWHASGSIRLGVDRERLEYIELPHIQKFK